MPALDHLLARLVQCLVRCPVARGGAVAAAARHSVDRAWKVLEVVQGEGLAGGARSAKREKVETGRLADFTYVLSINNIY